jgi:hypothetical protein
LDSAPKRSSGLVFAADFNDLDMALRVLHAVRRAESVTLTMPWMGSKSDELGC